MKKSPPCDKDHLYAKTASKKTTESAVQKPASESSENESVKVSGSEPHTVSKCSKARPEYPIKRIHSRQEMYCVPNHQPLRSVTESCSTTSCDSDEEKEPSRASKKSDRDDDTNDAVFLPHNEPRMSDKNDNYDDYHRDRIKCGRNEELIPF